MRFTGERVVPKDMDDSVIHVLQEHLARYNFALAYCVDKKVLDAACGVGYGSWLLAQVAREVTGYEKDRETVSYARAHYGANSRQVDLNSIYPIHQQYWDVVVSFETIEHLLRYKVFVDFAQSACQTFIFSLPFRSASPFHVDNSDEHFHEMVAYIQSQFSRLEWFYQQGMNLYNQADPAWAYYYLVGVAHAH